MDYEQVSSPPFNLNGNVIIDGYKFVKNGGIYFRCQQRCEGISAKVSPTGVYFLKGNHQPTCSAKIEEFDALWWQSKVKREIIPWPLEEFTAEIRKLDEDCDDFRRINTAFDVGYFPTVIVPKASIAAIYSIKSTSVQPFQPSERRIQLFHSTRLENVFGIIRNGLKCKPPAGTMINGSDYGDGVYLASSSGYSAEFSRPRPGDEFIPFFLAEVKTDNMQSVETMQEANIMNGTSRKTIHVRGRSEFQDDAFDENENVRIPARKPLMDCDSTRESTCEQYCCFREENIQLRNLIICRLN